MQTETTTARWHLPQEIAQVGRQPIFDRELQVYGYELLYRSENATTPDGSGFDGDLATARTVLNSFLEFGMHRLVGSNRAFVNMTHAFFTNIKPLPIDKQRLVIEVLEDIDLSPDVIQGVRELHTSGYSIALDDYCFEPRWDPLLPFCSIVKVDLSKIDIAQYKAQIKDLKSQGLVLLAEKVETREDYRRTRKLEFDLFQGYFFAKPETLTTPRLQSNHNLILKMIACLNDPDSEVGEIVELVACDPAISFKVLRFINSAALGLPRKVDSIHDAVVYIGLDRLRAWSTLFVMANMDYPTPELLTTSLIRAELCKSLAKESPARGKPDSGYTVGLLSTLDAMFSQPMEQLLRDLPLPLEMITALTEHTGPYGECLQCALDLEQGGWEGTTPPDVSPRRLNEIYVQTLERVEVIRKELL